MVFSSTIEVIFRKFHGKSRTLSRLRKWNNAKIVVCLRGEEESVGVEFGDGCKNSEFSVRQGSARLRLDRG